MSIPPRYFPESFKEEIFVDYNKKPLHPQNYHFHRNHLEICLVTSGRFCYVVNNERYELEPFDMVFIQNPVEHKIVTFDSSEKPECFIVNFDSSLFSENSAEMTLLYNIFSHKKLSIPTEDIHNVYNLFISLAIESNYPAPFSKQIMKNYLYTLLATLYRITHNFSSRFNLSSEIIIESATKYIARNYHNDISVNDIAKFCNVNVAHLSRRFKKVIGMTIVKYINSIRIHHASTMLLETNKSITEISELCGFNSPKRFCEVFKTYKGVSAREFRKTRE